ncbi:Uncharacterized protein FKW44_012999 [Caligus rogercresseyi]|uniref:CRAL-TRIO domain-containing protein n=1 Tax=Caligus rogercresseyi TaxID=217165 RepID=A0A7T8HKS0_CALRO|nr:Uncharacterized protein FKW44_012999 [Caligus rogercresseyi]
MSGSSYGNFDYELSSKILHLLKGSYPARLKKVLIVTAPLWFKAPFKVLRLFVREKLRDRVYTVSNPQLSLHLPQDAIPLEMGGRLRVEHEEWLKTCAAHIREGEASEATLDQLKSLTSGLSPPERPQNGGDTLTSSPSSGFSEEELSGEDAFGLELLEFIQHVRAKGRRGLYEEYEEICSRTALRDI